METETETQEEQFVEEVQSETNGQEQKEVQTAPPPISQASLDAAFEKLSTSIQTAVRPKEEVQQMSEADQKKLWAIYDPEETQKDFMRKFFRLNPEATKEEEQEARGMFKAMQEGIVKQSLTGARNLFQMKFKELEERYKPLEDHYREAQAEKLATSFYSAYPALAVQSEDGSYRYMGAMRIAAQDLAQKSFTSRPEYFKALAERASDIIKGILPEFDLGKQQNNKTKTTTSPSLPRTRVGGSGGTSRGGDGQENVKVLRGANGDDSGTLDWTA